jgi:hypothetical protein
MKLIIRNLLSIFAGLVVGSIVNMGIISLGGSIIPPPEGADVLTMEGLKASIHLFQPKHFLMPFLAHALGTFFGAILTTVIAASYKKHFAMAIGGLFLLGGVANIYMLPSPLWFSLLDLIVAYLPMAFLAWLLVGKK